MIRPGVRAVLTGRPLRHVGPVYLGLPVDVGRDVHHAVDELRAAREVVLLADGMRR